MLLTNTRNRCINNIGYIFIIIQVRVKEQEELHMKRLIVSVLVLLLAFPSVAMAGDINLEELDFESLLALKQEVDAEFNTREESGPFALQDGIYRVGTDLKAGTYYYTFLKPGSSAYGQLFLYEDFDEYESKDYDWWDVVDLHEKPNILTVSDGNIVKVSGTVHFKILPFVDSDFSQYDPPDGTLVSQGVYYVGEDLDIPVGKYFVYPGTVKEVLINLYKSEKKYKSKDRKDYYFVNVYDPQVPVELNLEEGNVIEISMASVIMVKQDKTKLNFD